jgi:hypothetical protein
MVMLPIQKHGANENQKAVPVHWTEAFWVVPIQYRTAAPTVRRLVLWSRSRGAVLLRGENKHRSVLNGAPDSKPRRGRGQIRRDLGCPEGAWAPLIAFASLPLRCRPAPRLRLQHLFRNPGL